MSSASKNIDGSDAIVEESITLSDDNSSTSAETCEAARQFKDTKESKQRLESASDADVSNVSSSDSTQTVTETEVDQKSRFGSKLQRSPRQNFEAMKFDEKCQLKLDESSDEKESKLSSKKCKKSPKKSTYDATVPAGCSSEQGQVSETGSKRTRPDFDKQVDYMYSASESKAISEQDIIASGAEKPSEVATKKNIPKKFPEKFKKTRLGSSEIGADVIEDAIDHTDDSVFTTVRSSDFITANIIPNTEIVTDITEDAIDNTDQEVFTKISSEADFADVSNFIRDTGKAIDAAKDLSDQADETSTSQVKFSDFVATAGSNIIHKEISHADTERNIQEQSSSQTLDFQEVISGKVFSATAPAIFSQISRIEDEAVSQLLQNIDIEKTESSVDSNPSDDRMEFSSASTVQSVIGYNTDIEKMECSSDTYSGFENFKIDSESNATLEKMECKSESSASHDKMDTDSLSLKSNETEGMEYSCDAMSCFEQKPTSTFEEESTIVQRESDTAQENEFTSLQERQSIIVEESDSISLQEKERIHLCGNESVVPEIESVSVPECESIGVPECESISGQVCQSSGVQECQYIAGQDCKSTFVQEKESIFVQENDSIRVTESKLLKIVQKNESTSILQSESISNQQTASVSDQENKSVDVAQHEDAGTLLLESVSSLIGDFVSRTIQETVSGNLQESLSGLLEESTISHSLSDIKCSASNESDSSSNEIKAIYESNSALESVSERKFAIPRKEASDTEEYDFEQKQVGDTEVEKKRSSCGETSLKRRNSAEDEEAGKSSDVDKQATSHNREQKDTGFDERKDSDDKKGPKKLKK